MTSAGETLGFMSIPGYVPPWIGGGGGTGATWGSNLDDPPPAVTGGAGSIGNGWPPLAPANTPGTTAANQAPAAAAAAGNAFRIEIDAQTAMIGGVMLLVLVLAAMR